MNEKHYFLNSHGFKKRKLPVLFLSLILVVILPIYLIGCSDSDSSGSSQEGYSTNSGIPIATLNQGDKPPLDVSSQGQVAWAQSTGDMDTIYSYRNQSASLPGTGIPTIVTTVEYCSDIATNNAGQIAWLETDGDDLELWLYSNGEKEQIPTDQGDHFYLNMNSSGHLVWTAVENEFQYQIYLYRDGTTTQLTEDNLNLFANINDNGDIAWREVEENGENLSIYLRDKNGQVNKITEENLDAFSWDKEDMSSSHGVLSSTGSVVWLERVGEVTQVFMYSDGRVTQITNDDKDSRFPYINNLDQIVWEGRDDNDTEIFLYSGGTITQLTDNEIYDTKPRINNHGQVVWEASDGNDNEIFIYDNGTIVQLTDNEIYDDSPWISDSGQVFWTTLKPGEATWYYANIMTTVPGQESRTDAESQESSTIPRTGTASVTAGEEAGAIPQIESPALKSPADPDKFTFVVFGDTRGQDSASAIFWQDVINKPALNCLRDRLLNMVKPDLIFFGGDVSNYFKIKAWDWFKHAFVLPLNKAGHNVYMTIGNHDLYKFGIPMYGLSRQQEYQNRFNFGWVPKNGPDSKYNNLAYWFIYGSSFFIIFDTYFVYDTAIFSDPHCAENIDCNPKTHNAQINWFANFGNDYFNQFKHKFAFSHAPVFSVTGAPKEPNMLRLWHSMTQRNFDIYFGSHTHIYSRKRIPTNYMQQGFAREMDQVIAGRMTVDSDKNKVSVSWADWNIKIPMHFVVVEVDGHKVTATTWGMRNCNFWEVIDSFIVEKQ